MQNKWLAKRAHLIDSCNERQYFNNHSANSTEQLQRQFSKNQILL